MSPAGHSSAHAAVKVIGAPKPANPPAPGPPGPAPASDSWYTKQQTWPAEQCCELEHESEDPEQEPADVQVSDGAANPPPSPPPNPPGPNAPASGAAGAAGAA